MSETIHEAQAALLDAIENVLSGRSDAQHLAGSDPVVCVDYTALLELEDAYDAYVDAILEDAAHE